MFFGKSQVLSVDILNNLQKIKFKSPSRAPVFDFLIRISKLYQKYFSFI